MERDTRERSRSRRALPPPRPCVNDACAVADDPPRDEQEEEEEEEEEETRE